MKVAVTYENGQIFQHFGHTEQFKIYTTENGKIISSEVIDTNGSGHGALAGLLLSLDVALSEKPSKASSSRFLTRCDITTSLPTYSLKSTIISQFEIGNT